MMAILQAEDPELIWSSIISSIVSILKLVEVLVDTGMMAVHDGGASAGNAMN